LAPRTATTSLHLGGSSFRDLPAEVEHVHTVGDSHHEVHVVLDEEDGQLERAPHPPDQRPELLDFLVVQSAGRLVEQEQAGAGGERPRQLDALHRSERKPGGRAVRDRREADLFEQVAGIAITAHVLSHEDVLEDGHGGEELDVLKRPGNSLAHDAIRRRPQQALAVESDLTGVGPVQPGDQIEQRRLSCAVWADQPRDLAALDRERNIVDGDNPAELARHVLDREEGHSAPTLRRDVHAEMSGRRSINRA
jgi:hypothetical protein